MIAILPELAFALFNQRHTSSNILKIMRDVMEITISMHINMSCPRTFTHSHIMIIIAMHPFAHSVARSTKLGSKKEQHCYLSFIYPERGGFSEIFPEVMIFPEGFSPREISSLKEIFH